jgi:hypothetical protein
MTTTEIMQKQPCPFCKTKFEWFEGSGNDKVIPGVVLFCTSCSGVSTLDEHYKVVPMSPEQFNAFSSEDQEFIRNAVRKIQTRITPYMKQLSPDMKSVGTLGKVFTCPLCTFKFSIGVSTISEVKITPGSVVLCFIV